MGECFANEIVQWCGKGYEIEVTKMGQNYALFLQWSCPFVCTCGSEIAYRIFLPENKWGACSFWWYSLLGFIQRAWLLPKCFLKAYNVSACYQKLHKWEAMLILVNKVWPCLSPNVPMLVNKVFPKKQSTYFYILYNWSNQVHVKQPWCFYSSPAYNFRGHNGPILCNDVLCIII